VTATYTALATTTLGSNTASVTFSSISGSYTDLVLVINGQLSTVGSPIMRVNSDSGTNYSCTQIYGDGSSAVSGRVSNFSSAVISFLNANCAINEDFAIIVNLQNYSNSTTYKTFLSRVSKATQQAEANVTMWRNTNAITSVQVLVSSSGVYKSGSTFTLYGIAAA